MHGLSNGSTIVNIIAPPDGPWEPSEGLTLVEQAELAIGWISDGAGGWIAPPPPVLTNDDIITALTKALEAHYDATAQQRRYDTRYTCTLRAGYAGPFQAEGQAFAIWMDGCNVYAYSVMDAVIAGQRAIPTAAELIAELPAMVWP